jgi:hypothetical protein
VKHLLVFAVAAALAVMYIVQHTSLAGLLSPSQVDVGGWIGVFVGNVVIGEVILAVIRWGERRSPGDRQGCAACGFENSLSRRSCKRCRQPLPEAA